MIYENFSEEQLSNRLDLLYMLRKSKEVIAVSNVNGEYKLYYNRNILRRGIYDYCSLPSYVDQTLPKTGIVEPSQGQLRNPHKAVHRDLKRQKKILDRRRKNNFEEYNSSETQEDSNG